MSNNSTTRHLITFGADHEPGLHKAMMIVGCSEEEARRIATALYPPLPGSTFGRWAGIYTDGEVDAYCSRYYPHIFQFVLITPIAWATEGEV